MGNSAEYTVDVWKVFLVYAHTGQRTVSFTLWHKQRISCKRWVREQRDSYILQLFFAYAAVRKTLLSGYAYTALKTDSSPFFMTKEKL